MGVVTRMMLRLPATGRVSSPFGPRTGVGSTYHRGIDFSWMRADGVQDWNIYAAADGVIAQTSFVGGYGNLTIIDHGGGRQTWYAHQARFTRCAGQRVKAGDIIGIIGNTGASFGAHLHFEYRIHGVQVDPALHFTSTAGDGDTPIEENDMAKMIRFGYYNDGGKNRYTLINYATGRIWQTYDVADATNMSANLNETAETWSPQLAANLVALMGVIGPQPGTVQGVDEAALAESIVSQISARYTPATLS